jgi:hypothetical protein
MHTQRHRASGPRTKSLIKFVMRILVESGSLVVRQQHSCSSPEGVSWTQHRARFLCHRHRCIHTVPPVPDAGHGQVRARQSAGASWVIKHLRSTISIGRYPPLGTGVDMPELPRPSNSEGLASYRCGGTHARKDLPSYAEPLPPSAFLEFEGPGERVEKVQKALQPG